ncbi:MAG TPA: hypothetical protein VFC09_13015 [Candidatus Dormibacteraeota bacterium]|nr:hypothetical protein [Candidatus Dormibacteraeota bacterium]
MRLSSRLVLSFALSVCVLGCGSPAFSIEQSTAGSAQGVDTPAAPPPPVTTQPTVTSVTWREPPDTVTPGYSFRASHVRLGYSTGSNLPLTERGQLNISFSLENIQTDRAATAPTGWTFAYATAKWQQLGAIGNETENSACEPIKGHADYCIAGSILSGDQFFSEWWQAGSSAIYGGGTTLQPPTIAPGGAAGVTVYGRTLSSPVSHGDAALVMVDRGIIPSDSFNMPLAQAEAGIDVVVFVIPDGAL